MEFRDLVRTRPDKNGVFEMAKWSLEQNTKSIVVYYRTFGGNRISSHELY